VEEDANMIMNAKAMNVHLDDAKEFHQWVKPVLLMKIVKFN
jgi:hypothetical protein